MGTPIDQENLLGISIDHASYVNPAFVLVAPSELVVITRGVIYRGVGRLDAMHDVAVTGRGTQAHDLCHLTRMVGIS